MAFDDERRTAEEARRAAEAADSMADATDPPSGWDSASGVGRGLGGVGRGLGTGLGHAGELTDSDALEDAGAVAGTVGQAAGATASTIDGVGALRDFVGEVVGSSDEKKVRYAFTSDGDPGSEWMVQSVEWTEQLGEPYEAVIDLVNEDMAAVPSLLLGHDGVLTLRRADAVERRLCGIVRRVEHGRTSDRFVFVRVHLVPALHALSLNRDSRIFQDVTVRQVVEAVLGAGLEPYGREVRLELEREYPKRETVVQYQESDLDFVQRLLEEEGIALSFEHDGDVEVAVLTDHNEAFVPVSTMDGGEVPLVLQQAEVVETEPVRSFQRGVKLTPTSASVLDFDWTQESFQLYAEQRTADDRGLEREVYDHGRALTIGDYDAGVGKYQAHDAWERSMIDLERRQLGRGLYFGHGEVVGFGAGRVFDLKDHPQAELDGSYLILRVVHRGRSEALEGLGGGDEDGSYHNEMVCTLREGPYRPRRHTPKPRIHGVQTAIVVGPEGEEVYTDEHGRVKVCFHWDRRAEGDERSSAWVRVMQSWAGAGFGAMFLPRIGMEVVVTFLDGDPDRPLVTGCVYNGVNRPPYPLPDEKTKSTLRTQSSPGGEGFNELRFEDAAGNEEIYLHAQKDLKEVVKGSHSHSVGGDHNSNVTKNRKTVVDEGDVLEVTDERAEYLGSKYVEIAGGETHVVYGEGGCLFDVEHAHRVHAKGKIELVSGDSKIIVHPTGIELVAAGGASIMLGTKAELSSADGHSTIEMADGILVHAGFDFEVGAENVKLVAGTEVSLDGGSKVTALGGECSFNGRDTMTVESSGPTTIKGNPIQNN